MKKTFFTNILFCLFVFAVAQNGGDSLTIIDKKVPFGMRETATRKIDAIIVHSTFNNSGGEKYDIEGVIAQFQRYGVSAHYVIDREGIVYQLVVEKNISFHAGRCLFPDGKSNGNERSIGIEIMTSFDEKPTEKQMQSLVVLVNQVKKREKIKYILRHSDIAPSRKTDPWNFDWENFLEKLKIEL